MCDGFYLKNLVSDIELYGKLTNDKLVNPWGLLIDRCRSFWIAANGTGYLLRLDRNYKLILTVVVPAADPEAGPGKPTGIDFNRTKGFLLSGTIPAKIVIVSEDGVISGYNPKVDPDNAIIKVTTPDAVYKGVAIAGGFLFAANFHSGLIEKYDQSWNAVATFTDPSLFDAGYAPFNIIAHKKYLYVAYAKQDEDKEDDEAGLGNGFIDIFNLDGLIIRRLINRGALNSPWGMFIEDEKLYVGNFGDGRINVFNLKNGQLYGPLLDKFSNIITVDGLWAILPVLDGSKSRSSSSSSESRKESIYLTAGINHEANGLFAVLNQL